MKRRRLLIFFCGLCAVAALMAFAAWLFPQKVLTVDSGPVAADVIVLLGGGPDRAGHAAELFKGGEASKILVSGSGDCVSNEKLLEKDGVPATAITLEGKSHSTRENAEFSIPLLRALGAKRVIIVTSWFHSRRGLACFEHYAPDIQFYSRPSYFGYVGKADEAWSKEQGAKEAAEGKAERKMMRGYANSEYLKMLGYWVCYGVCPF